MALGLVTAVAVLSACQPGQESETERNARLRQGLREDRVFQMLPANVRANLREVVPRSTGFVGPELGLNGFEGLEPATSADPETELLGWDRKVRVVGWSARGGECIQPLDSVKREIGGIWVKKVRSTWAFFDVVLKGPNVGFGLFIRPVADRNQDNVFTFSSFQPGPIGCPAPTGG